MKIKIEKICNKIVLICFGALSFCLTVLSMLETSTETTIEESRKIIYLSDHPFKHIVVVLGVLLLVCGLQRWKDRRNPATEGIKEKKDRIAGILLIFVFGIAGILYISFTQLQPISDPGKLQTIADEMLQGDFHQFQEGEYMHRYPFQSGYLLLIYYLMKVAGSREVLILQFANVLAAVWSYYTVYRMAGRVWNNRNNAILLAEILFTPMLLYTSFVYGNLLSLGMAAEAIYLEYRYFEEKKVCYIPASAILISVAIVLKSNSLIFFCGMLLYGLYQLFREEKIVQKGRIVLILGVFLLVYLAGGKLITRQMERIIRQPLPQGMPKLTWVAMGLEDGGEAPGYWNGTSVRIYTENDYDAEKTTQAAAEEIKEQIKQFRNNWKNGVKFFAKKTAAQWSEPTFGSIEISRNRESEKPLPGWISGIYEENENAWYIELCNLYQTLVYMGTLLYVLTRWKTVRTEELIYAVIVMGGFAFHLFWEGKSQYVMPYFWLLIPYAVMGYEMTGKKLSDISSRYLKNGIYKPGENS